MKINGCDVLNTSILEALWEPMHDVTFACISSPKKHMASVLQHNRIDDSLEKGGSYDTIQKLRFRNHRGELEIG